MNQSFNPYLKWLGIRALQPDHYQLLGVERFEDDTDVIMAAADRQMAHVRKYQNGPHSALSQELLNELAAAKICLLSNEQRAAYDESLLAITPSSHSSSRLVDELPRRERPRSVLLLSTVVLAAVLVACFLYLSGYGQRRLAVEPIQNGSRAEPATVINPADKTPTIANDPQTAEVAEPKDHLDNEEDIDDKRLLVQKTQIGEEPPEIPTSIQGEDQASRPIAGPQDVAVEPWKLPKPNRRSPMQPTKGESARAKLLMAFYQRNQKQADKFVAKVMPEAETHEAQLEAIRLEALYWKFTEFWQKVDRGLKRTEVGSKLDYRGQTVTVTTKTKTQLELQAANGAKRQFDIARARIGPDAAIALARANGQATGPMLDVMIAVFLATDRRGDLTEAKRLLQLAKEAGVPVEVLLANPHRQRDAALDSPASVLDTALFATDAEPITDIGSGESMARTIPPASDERTRQLRMLRDAYAELYDSGDEQALASRLLADANRTDDDMAARFMMYQEAIRLATKIGSVETAHQAIRALEYRFDIDGHQNRIEAFRALRRNTRDAAQREKYTQILIEHATNLIEVDSYAEAHDTVQLALQAAQPFRQPKQVSALKKLKLQIESLRQKYTELQLAMAALSQAESVDDRNLAFAHYAIGEFLTFAKGDFELGCQHLLLGSDPELKGLALLELEAPTDPQKQLELADRWWDVAELSNSGVIRSHASAWYERAIPALQGVSKQRALARIQEWRTAFRPHGL